MNAHQARPSIGKVQPQSQPMAKKNGHLEVTNDHEEEFEEWEPELEEEDEDYDSDEYIFDKAHFYPEALLSAEKKRLGSPAYEHIVQHYASRHCPKGCPFPRYNFSEKCTPSQSLPVF